MTSCTRSRAPAFFLAGLLMAWPGTGSAEGGYLRPSVALGLEYDDNLFFAPADPQADSITLAQAAMDSGYESASLDAFAHYAINAERYADHPELDTGNARQQAVAGIHYRPMRRLEFSVDGEYVETNSPGELSPEVGLAFGRLRARRVSGSSGVSWWFDHSLVGAVTVSGARDTLEGDVDVGTCSAAMDLEKHFSERNTGSLVVESRRFDFADAETVSAQVLAAGWATRLTRQVAMTLSMGQYMTGDITKPEASAALRYDYRQGSVALRYARRQSVALGHSEPVDTKSLAMVLEYAALPDFGIRAVPSVVESAGSDSDTEIRRLDIEAAYVLGRSVALVARVRLARQAGSLEQLANIDIARSTAFVGMVIAFGSPSERERSPLEWAAF